MSLKFYVKHNMYPKHMNFYHRYKPLLKILYNLKSFLKKKSNTNAMLKNHLALGYSIITLGLLNFQEV
jgi:hypothetical protein